MRQPTFKIKESLTNAKTGFCFLITFTMILTSSASSSLPGWVLPELRKYPSETYLFDVGKGAGAEAFKEAAARAHRRVATRILGKITSIIRDNKDELQHDMVREHYSAVLEDYCSWRQVYPALKMKGLSVRNLSVDLARTDQETYALVYIERDKLKDIYANHASELRQEIKRRLEIAKAFEVNLDIEGAVRAYLRTYPLYEALKEAEILQIGAEYASNYSDAFGRLAAAATYTGENLWSHRQVIKRVEELTGKVNDILGVVSSQLSYQILSLSGSVSVHPMIYEDSEMISPFEQEFTSSLGKRLRWITIDIVRDFKPTSPDLDKINRDLPPYRLSPSCWKNGDEITIRTILRNVNTGEFLASSIVRFLKSQQRNTFTYEPSRHDQVQTEQEAFDPKYYTIDTRSSENSKTPASEVLVEHQFSPVDGLKVDVWTGEGQGPLYYTDGDKVKIFASVNQPAYLRLLYIFADQRRTLLVNNYYIGSSEINRTVEIGEFLCAPPFGTERLVIAARTEEFPAIQTREEDGHFFLEDQDAASASQKFRALKPIPKEKANEQQLIGPQQSDDPPRFQQSEAQLVLTTRKK